MFKHSSLTLYLPKYLRCPDAKPSAAVWVIRGQGWRCSERCRFTPSLLHTLDLDLGGSSAWPISKPLRPLFPPPHCTPIPPCYRLLILGLQSHLKHPFLKEKKVLVSCCVQLFRIPWNEAHQAPWSMGFSRQEHWSGLPFLSPRDLLDPGVKPRFPTLRADSLPSELPFMLVLQSHFKHHFLRKAHPRITFHQMVIPSQVSSWTFL